MCCSQGSPAERVRAQAPPQPRPGARRTCSRSPAWCQTPWRASETRPRASSRGARRRKWPTSRQCCAARLAQAHSTGSDRQVAASHEASKRVQASWRMRGSMHHTRTMRTQPATAGGSSTVRMQLASSGGSGSSPSAAPSFLSRIFSAASSSSWNMYTTWEQGRGVQGSGQEAVHAGEHRRRRQQQPWADSNSQQRCCARVACACARRNLRARTPAGEQRSRLPRKRPRTCVLLSRPLTMVWLRCGTVL